MSSSPDLQPSPELRLSVTARSPLAEIFVIDDQFALVDRSVGNLECSVAPGVYKVKAKLADATSERLVLLDSDTSLDVSADLTVGSAVPIEPAAVPIEPAAVPTAAGEPPPRARGLTAGALRDHGSQILLMARRGGLPGETGVGVLPPVMSLHHLDGGMIGSVESGQDPDVHQQSARISVEPGPYLVRRRDSIGDWAEQAVFAVSGWQTQVFAAEERGDDARIGGSHVSVLMAEHDFSPSDPDLPLIEEARTALADERKVASAVLVDLLDEIDNPMLGLFGAHLMLISRDAKLAEEQRLGAGRVSERVRSAPVGFDQDRFDRIVDRLVEVLGSGHPDVVALATQRHGQDVRALPPITAPPMLWRSWVLLIAASNLASHLVPVGTWQQTLHVLPLRPFFLWTPAGQSGELRQAWTQHIAGSLSGSDSAVGAGLPAGPVSAVRSAVVAGAELSAEVIASAQELPAPTAVDDEARRRISAGLLIPRAAVDRLADGEAL